MQRNVAGGRLQFTTDVELAVAHATLQFIAVGTPPIEDGSADLQYVLAAARLAMAFAAVSNPEFLKEGAAVVSADPKVAVFSRNENAGFSSTSLAPVFFEEVF